MMSRLSSHPACLALTVSLLLLPALSAAEPLPSGVRLRLGSPDLIHPGTLMSLVFAPDGKTLASAGSDGHVRLWDVKTGHLVSKVGKGYDTNPAAGNYYGAAISALTFSADSKVLAGVEGNRAIRTWDVVSGKELRVVHEGQAGLVSGCVLSADGKLAVPLLRDKKAKLVETATGNVVKEFEGHTNFVFAAALSDDGKLLATGSEDLTARVWRVEDGKLLATFEGHRDGIKGLGFSPDGKQLASVSTDATVRVWEIARGKELHRLAAPRLTNYSGYNQTTRVAFSADGKSLTASLLSAASVRWELPSGKETARFEPTFNPYSQTALTAVSPDGTLIARAPQSGRIVLQTVATGKELHQFPGHSMPVHSLAISPDGKTAASGSADRTIRLWDLASGAEKRVFTGHSGSVAFLFFSPDGRSLISASNEYNDKAVSVWDVATGQEKFALRTQGQQIQGVALSPDGKLLGIVSPEPQNVGARLYDLESRKELQSIKARTAYLAFSLDGTHLVATGTDGGVHLYETSTGQDVRTLAMVDRRGYGYQTARFAPDGRSVLIAGLDGSLRFHEVATGKAVRVLGADPKASDPAQAVVRIAYPYRTTWPAAFSPDGKTLATIGRDNAVHVWELTTGKERTTFAAHEGTVNALAYTPDGKYLVSAGADATVVVRAIADEAKAPALSAQELKSLWDDLLNDDAAKAYQAIRKLRQAPKEAGTFLKTHVKPIPGVAADKIDKFISDLDSNDFEVRKIASEELEKLGDLAGTAMKRTLDKKPPLEVARRLEMLLEKVDAQLVAGEPLRCIRALEVLEHLDTPEARAAMEALAKGAEGARLTREAQDSLARHAKWTAKK